MRISNWPTIFDLNLNETYIFKRKINGEVIERIITLLSLKEYWEPDYWTRNDDKRTLRLVEVTLDISGVIATLLCRPYQMPVEVNGISIYVESTYTWANCAEISTLANFQSDIRLSAVIEGESWGPTSFVFPLKSFRWRSSTYNNTWNSLVPYNSLYYHRGEDFGAIPDCLLIVAALDGEVIRSPIPNGDGKSNTLVLKTDSGIDLEYAHMNIETVEKSLNIGQKIVAGTKLAKTGMTWSGLKSQEDDPHLHFSIATSNSRISTYPIMIESYLRAYDDKIIAIAGGNYFTTPGMEIEIDGSRSIARAGQEIEKYEWHLHDGRVLHKDKICISYDAPGLYSEELIIRNQDGDEERDFAQVRVYEPTFCKKIALGWVYYNPVRGIYPGTSIEFWNRLRNTSDVFVCFGDGSDKKIVLRSIYHSYNKPGIYTVTFSSVGPNSEPITVKTRVVVESRK